MIVVCHVIVVFDPIIDLNNNNTNPGGGEWFIKV